MAEDVLTRWRSDRESECRSDFRIWRNQVSGDFASRLWPGGHFFLFQTERNSPQPSPAAKWLGFAAVVLATINVVGGYMVTDRMLAMFKKKDNSTKGGPKA